MDKELKVLVERLNRIFPDLQIYSEGHYTDSNEENYCPPVNYDWYDIIKILKDNGLDIKNI
jgi:hypothetical protein